MTLVQKFKKKSNANKRLKSLNKMSKKIFVIKKSKFGFNIYGYRKK